MVCESVFWLCVAPTILWDMCGPGWRCISQSLMDWWGHGGDWWNTPWQTNWKSSMHWNEFTTNVNISSSALKRQNNAVHFRGNLGNIQIFGFN